MNPAPVAHLVRRIWFSAPGSAHEKCSQVRRLDEPALNRHLRGNSVSLAQIAALSPALGRNPTRGESPMRTLGKAVAIVISSALAASSVSAAFAESQWERNHPRRDQVNDRLANQNRRINHELKEGEITKQQANQLHRDDRAIRREERTMARFNNGHITKSEQKALNQQENAVSGQIGR
jgi:hypothetical protein